MNENTKKALGIIRFYASAFAKSNKTKFDVKTYQDCIEKIIISQVTHAAPRTRKKEIKAIIEEYASK